MKQITEKIKWLMKEKVEKEFERVLISDQVKTTWPPRKEHRRMTISELLKNCA